MAGFNKTIYQCNHTEDKCSKVACEVERDVERENFLETHLFTTKLWHGRRRDYINSLSSPATASLASRKNRACTPSLSPARPVCQALNIHSS